MTDELLIVAGWVLTVPAPRPAYAGSRHPEEILTISDCIQQDLPRPQFGDWYTDRREAARAQRQAAPHSQLITVALAPDDAGTFVNDVFLDETTRPQARSSPGFDLLSRRRPLDNGARIHGYEVVGAEPYLDFHSWHCHGYADDVADVLGIHTNPLGLPRTRSEARAVLAWMLSRPPEHAPKPVPWTVVALATTYDPDRLTCAAPPPER